MLRRLAYLAVTVAVAHLVFGAIVRITGSGMGCGDHWPKCSGQWFPPLDRPDLIIELGHRYLAAALLLAVAAVAWAAWRRRHEPGVGGRGGVLRMAAAALGVCIATALFGALTVKLGNAPLATVGHWLLAAALLALSTATAIRAGGFGGATARSQSASGRTARAALAAALVTLVVITLGGLTAKVPGAAGACQGFPLCSGGGAGGGLQHLQLTHRVLAYLLTLHLIGVAIGLTRRGEARTVVTASRLVLGAVVLQIGVAAAMVLGHLPPVLRSAHQATGVFVWLTVVIFAYLARIAAGRSALPHVAGRDRAGGERERLGNTALAGVTR